MKLPLSLRSPVGIRPLAFWTQIAPVLCIGLSACVLEANGGLRVDDALPGAASSDESGTDDDDGADSDNDDGDDSDKTDSSSDPSGEDSATPSDPEDEGDSSDIGDETETDTGTTDGGDTDPDTGEDPIEGDVEISITTVAYGGRYSPRHVGAIWIEDLEGRYLKTLEAWAARREKHLAQWLTASGGDRTDAISGATFRNHLTHELRWNRIDESGVEHGPGEYVLRAEYTEDHSSASDPGPQLELRFTMGDGPSEFNDSNSNFSNVSVKTPG